MTTSTMFPDVRLTRTTSGLALTINGERHLPLIMAFARTHYMARGKPDFDYANDVVYEQMRRVYDAGIRVFQPCMPEIGWGPDGQFDYGNFDTVMRRLVEVLPEAWFILRVIIPPPPLPKDEQILVSRRPGDTSDAEACQVFDQISLFSETYRDYAPGAMMKIMEHLAALPEAGRIIGTVICGAGFEWNWGNPGGNWGLMMDICPAVTREFGRFLERKYGTVDALRAAWGDLAADFANPPLPGIEERTHSDIGGFRDPAHPRSRWIQDFLDCYNDHPTRMLTTIFDRITASTIHDSRFTIHELPPLFHGVFGMAVMNTAYSGVQTMPGENRPVLEHPALGFITCCLTYCDRKAGGVSVYMNAGYHSHTLHGKLAIGEADIRPGTANDPWNEASLEDGIASMRREFAAMLLCQRQGIWYFDMPGGWFDRPELLAELARQQQVGAALLDLPHTNVAETLVVFENRSWKYFGLADHQLALKTVWSGGNQQLLSDMTQDNIERLQRLGAPNDAIVAEDFTHPALGRTWRQDGDPQADALRGFDCRAAACGVPRPSTSEGPTFGADYKLLIFPFSFLCDPATRAEIHRRVEAGATALFLYAAGLVDGETASLENMERLLGMTVRVDGPGVLAAVLDPALFPLPPEGEGQGEGVSRASGPEDAQQAPDRQSSRQSSRQSLGAIGNPQTHHFRYVIDDPRATPLALYADGAVAAALIPRGRGRIILSAVPGASVELYKLAARLAGVHLYSDTDDALYASGEFLVIHTREAGMKRLRFPRVVSQVTEVFTGEVVARNVREMTVNLPAKTTAVYRL